MNFDEFKKYKKIAESNEFDPEKYPEAVRIYQWMEQSGRIDEGFWGSIWSWLKKNFSIKASKLYKLADEYEKELIEEGRAQYKSMKDKKDITSKIRKEGMFRLSKSIEERMEIIAGDDPDYRELVRLLINKKELKMRRQMLTEFAGKLDDEFEQQEKIALDKEEPENDEKLREHQRKMTPTDLAEQKPIADHLQTKIISDLRKYNEIGITRDNMVKFVGTIVMYIANLSKRTRDVKLTNNAADEILSKYFAYVKEFSRRVKSNNGNLSTDEVYVLIRKELNKAMSEEKPDMFDTLKNKIKNDITRAAEKKNKEKTEKKEPEKAEEDSEDELPNDIVTPETEEVTDVEVKTMIDTAKEETDKEKPTVKDVTKEVSSTVKAYFEDNVETFLSTLKVKVEKFNGLSDTERNKMISNLEYEVNSDNKLDEPEEKDVISLLNNLIQIVGKIIPYYIEVRDGEKIAGVAVSNCIFEIYAIKKDIDKKLTDKNIDDIVEVIKNKNLIKAK